MFTLTSTWTLEQGNEQAGIAALKSLAQQVREGEEGTLLYLVHMPEMSRASQPTPCHLDVVFFEIYRDRDAFCAHVNGPIFKGFLATYGSLFLSTRGECDDSSVPAGPYLSVEFLDRKAGFIRSELVNAGT